MGFFGSSRVLPLQFIPLLSHTSSNMELTRAYEAVSHPGVGQTNTCLDVTPGHQTMPHDQTEPQALLPYLRFLKPDVCCIGKHLYEIITVAHSHTGAICMENRESCLPPGQVLPLLQVSMYPCTHTDI